jgi:histidinol dehydrogenase
MLNRHKKQDERCEPYFIKLGRTETQSQSDFETLFSSYLDIKREITEDIDKLVAGIIADVKKRGDKALLDYTFRYDHFTPPFDRFAIDQSDIDKALELCPPSSLLALKHAAERIESFHKRQLPENVRYSDKEGVQLGYRWTPISSVGLYVPGGTASYPSSVLMNAIPAKVAGVKRMAMVVPSPEGHLNPLVLSAAQIAGITEIYRIGGAQAIAALAYGTQQILPVDKIVGPGNAWVAAAKRRVYGLVGIDMIAGPSEILVVSDSQNDPTWIAADLLSQAEHDESAQSILITNDFSFAQKVNEEIKHLLSSLPRKKIAQKSWSEHGAIIVVPNLEQAIPLIDRIAPEHLELAIDQAEDYSNLISNAGSIFLGRHTPEAIGDYVGGPNHVLPTARSARFSSGLGVLDFMKRTTFIGCDEKSLKKIGADAVTLAKAEGLEAHALSVSVRLNKKP